MIKPPAVNRIAERHRSNVEHRVLASLLVVHTAALEDLRYKVSRNLRQAVYLPSLADSGPVLQVVQLDKLEHRKWTAFHTVVCHLQHRRDDRLHRKRLRSMSGEQTRLIVANEVHRNLDLLDTVGVDLGSSRDFSDFCLHEMLRKFGVDSVAVVLEALTEAWGRFVARMLADCGVLGLLRAGSGKGVRLLLRVGASRGWQGDSGRLGRDGCVGARC